ncbi:methionine ABC transporter ATP-binding protein [Gracilibacillus boraciitolerans JCM 21714]|uniref:Methionine ABC transporter ATP-binding protein n=1 Tax=Gracilibacillus boraciitolerans JCM 21714 TaxID=1298598 RepID=W4VNW6_9BACI|nr:methionine ABC transporter ATP-binding protein [Gracilibacillus boraciitolerans]GAE94424.1 methionine ABC transporter ATP-binding protein [Gracilibacillus boraciitolerans JCM 21714]
MIQIKNLSKLYQTKHQKIQAVDNVSLNIDHGEIFGVIGYSGAGKSTFVRLINRLEEPTEGSVVMHDQDITKMPANKLRKKRQKIGMIFQHFNLLWSRTVYDNIAFPLEIAGLSKAKRKEKVLELIHLVGLSGKEEAYPSQLSGGQKQRVGIARALANDPEVLLCDEATSALDPETTDDILDLLVSINKRLGLTIILITHEMHVIQKICHRVAVMESGKVVETGDVLDVFVKPQSKTTKRFVQQLNPLEHEKDKLSDFINDRDDSEVIKLHFIGNRARRALISEVAKKFDVEINILQGSIAPTQEGAYGTLFIEINGEKTILQNAIAYMKETGVEAEVVEHA